MVLCQKWNLSGYFLKTQMPVPLWKIGKSEMWLGLGKTPGDLGVDSELGFPVLGEWECGHWRGVTALTFNS